MPGLNFGPQGGAYTGTAAALSNPASGCARRINWVMQIMHSLVPASSQEETIPLRSTRSLLWVGVVGALLLGSQPLRASENVPHAPFAQWADVPKPGQLLVRATYEESEAYRVWAGGKEQKVDLLAGGEHYGIDINQGYLTFQYGLTKRWAADLSVGGTTVGWRYFSPDGSIHSTTGLMDTSFGVRYQIFNEAQEQARSHWLPTLTFRAGAVLPGTYSQDFPFAPGIRSAAIEPEFLARKHFGWTGLGAYGDGLYRWNRTTGNDQYIVSFGLFQQIKGWELSAGFRHLQTISGPDIILNENPDGSFQSLTYSAEVREVNDSIEAGFNYTTSKRHLKYGFYTRTVFDGSNTDRKFWIGGYVSMPFTLIRHAD